MSTNEYNGKPLEFEERSKANERLRALNYVQKLIENSRLENNAQDIEQLIEIKRLLNMKKYGLVWEEN